MVYNEWIVRYAGLERFFIVGVNKPMAVNELIQLLEDEREALFKTTDTMKSVYQTLAESIRTLTVPFRNAFAPEANIKPGIKSEQKRLVFSRHELQSLEGEVQNNTAGLIHLINNLYAIQNTLLRSPYFIDLTDISDIRQVQIGRASCRERV